MSLISHVFFVSSLTFAVSLYYLALENYPDLLVPVFDCASVYTFRKVNVYRVARDYMPHGGEAKLLQHVLRLTHVGNRSYYEIFPYEEEKKTGKKEISFVEVSGSLARLLDCPRTRLDLRVPEEFVCRTVTVLQDKSGKRRTSELNCSKILTGPKIETSAVKWIEIKRNRRKTDGNRFETFFFDPEGPYSPAKQPVTTPSKVLLYYSFRETFNFGVLRFLAEQRYPGNWTELKITVKQWFWFFKGWLALHSLVVLWCPSADLAKLLYWWLPDGWTYEIRWW